MARRDARHRADRRDGAVARADADRGEGRAGGEARARGPPHLPPSLPRHPRWAPRHLGHAAEHRREHDGTRQRGHPVRDQGDGGAGEAESDPRNGHQRAGAVPRHQHRLAAAGTDDGDRAARRREVDGPGGHPPPHADGDGLRADGRDPRRQAARAGVEVRHAFEIASSWILIALLVGIPLYGWVKGVKVYEAFVEGAKEGFNVAVRIIPFLVAILAAVGGFRAAGAMDALAKVLAPITGPLGLPAEVLPMALVRPLSGSGALGLLGNIFATPGLGPDSYAGRLGSVLQGSTETTFYVLSVYCGSVGIVRYRHALAAGLLADFTGLTASVLIARMLWM
ncbi:MAG: hypothetical protein E6J58_06965 [Deltaproteobacteria bacterium]|nr:MAG: hypothetical protein E6J67_04465 [Deltaproteobacteria bacterium]TMB39671.1 MAG: hypothetical protein E6J58_06965 [Deltaproteobacteria bacterium]